MNQFIAVTTLTGARHYINRDHVVDVFMFTDSGRRHVIRFMMVNGNFRDVFYPHDQVHKLLNPPS